MAMDLEMELNGLVAFVSVDHATLPNVWYEVIILSEDVSVEEQEPG
jgi:hypothetical protein